MDSFFRSTIDLFHCENKCLGTKRSQQRFPGYKEVGKSLEYCHS